MFLNWIAFLNPLTPSSHGPLCTGLRIDTTFLSLNGKLPPLCPRWSKLDQGSLPGKQILRYDLGYFQVCCISITGKWLELQILGLYPRSTESESLGFGPSNLCFHQFLGWLWYMLNFEKHWARLEPGRTNLIPSSFTWFWTWFQEVSRELRALVRHQH